MLERRSHSYIAGGTGADSNTCSASGFSQQSSAAFGDSCSFRCPYGPLLHFRWLERATLCSDWLCASLPPRKAHPLRCQSSSTDQTDPCQRKSPRNHVSNKNSFLLTCGFVLAGYDSEFGFGCMSILLRPQGLDPEMWGAYQ